MSVSRNILLCAICRSLFNDARQLRCGHSFCYQCIASRFDTTSNTIICPRCKRVHQFESLLHLETSLIADAFVMSLVSQHRRKTAVQKKPLLAFTEEQILQRSPAPFLIAKCAECSYRKELVVCPDCERVICFECIAEHQTIVNKTVQQKWLQCQERWKSIYEKSMLFDEQELDFKSYIYELSCRIEKRSTFLIETIEQLQKVYDDKLNQYLEKIYCMMQEVTTQYQSIDADIQILQNSTNHDQTKIENYLQQIKDFKLKLCRLEKQIDPSAQKRPIYSEPSIDLSILGTIVMQTDLKHLNCIANDDDNERPIVEEEEEEEEEEIHSMDDDTESIDSETSPQTMQENSNQNKELEDYDSTALPSVTLENLPNKKLLWSLNFKFVPQYVSLYRQSILFASDRWGCVSTWNYTNARTKPTPKKSFVLFPEFRVRSWSRIYVESFSVYKPYICVFAKSSDESVTNFIAFFTHGGQLQMKIEYDHRCSLRQLTCDESSKGNCIWSVDRGMQYIYKNDLPRTNQDIKPFLSKQKVAIQLNDASYDVIRMTTNQNILAILDARTQMVALFDKQSEKKVSVYSKEYLPTDGYKLWRVEIFPDNSLLLRFDDNERTGDRSQVIHHIVVHVKRNDSTKRYEPISQIQATNIYGFAIGSDSEVIAGIRKPNCFEGLISCYV